MDVMNELWRKTQRAGALQWLMASVLVLSTGFHAVACTCASGRSCESRTATPPGASACNCGNAKESSGEMDAAQGGCCSTKKAIKVAAASHAGGSCCAKHTAEASATADALAHWVSPHHACPCSISATDNAAFPARETAVIAQASSSDPRPDSAIVSHDVLPSSLSDGLVIASRPPSSSRSAMSTASLLCTYRC